MINSTTISGYVAATPKVETVGNTIKASFPLCNAEVYKDKNGVKHERLHKITVEAWGGLAENVVAVWLGLGKQVIVNGPLCSSSWQDKNGNWQRRNYIKANEIELLGEARPVEREPKKVAPDFVGAGFSGEENF